MIFNLICSVLCVRQMKNIFFRFHKQTFNQLSRRCNFCIFHCSLPDSCWKLPQSLQLWFFTTFILSGAPLRSFTIDHSSILRASNWSLSTFQSDYSRFDFTLWCRGIFREFQHILGSWKSVTSCLQYDRPFENIAHHFYWLIRISWTDQSTTSIRFSFHDDWRISLYLFQIRSDKQIMTVQVVWSELLVKLINT